MALIGFAVLLIGFMLRVQPLLVIALAALATGLGAGMAPATILADFGRAFNANRYVAVIYIILPLIGLLERYGLQERAKAIVGGFAQATFGRLLIAYLALRQISAGLGLISLAGHPQTVRPLLAPMAEAAAEAQAPLDDAGRERVRALAAATDNIGMFFGEDIFIAIGSILLMKGFLEQSGIVVEPFTLSLWAIPTAIAAFVIHSGRLLLIERRLRRR